MLNFWFDGRPSLTQVGQAAGSLATLGITDQLNSQNTQSCAFGYDDLGRSSTANCGTLWNQTFSFDPFSNISKTANPGITFLPTYNEATNRYTSVPGCTPTYQANGDVTNDCAHTYLTNNSGNLTKIDALVLVYDALGRMVEQNNNGVYTQIVYGPTGMKYALMNGATLKNAFVGLPGGGTAVYNSSGLAYYRHADWLGSSRLATHTTQSSQASYYYDGAYAPYGENYAGAGTTDLNFTGQNQDTAVGLFDFLYREYNSPQGRWAGPDPAGLEAVNMSNPQSWNRYSYIGNSPLNAVDPLGLHDPNELATYNDNFANPNAVTYYLNGIQVSSGIAQGLLSSGAAAQCPSSCNGFSNTGQYVQYVATAGSGAQGYVNFSDLQQGLYDANGTFYTPSQYNQFILSAYASQIDAQMQALASKIAAKSGGTITYEQALADLQTSGGHLQGGNYNFDAINGLGPNSLDCGGKKRCDGIHFPGQDANGNFFVHLDTSNPFTGPIRFLEHGFVDVLLGNIAYTVIPRPWP